MQTTAQPVAEASATRPKTMLPFILTALIFAGFNLRTVLLEVPPILPLIQRDLGLNYTATGFLNSLPLLMLGAAAYPAALLIGRLGARRAMTMALASMTVLALLRAVAPDAAWFFALTALLSLGIALGQTAAPMLVQAHFPRFIGQTTAAYSTGLMVGELVAASLTVPLVMPLLTGGQWRPTFIVWAVPVALSLILWLWFVPRDMPTHSKANSRRAESIAAPPIVLPRVRTRSSIRSWPVWQSSLILGCGSMLFFGMDTWIPVYLHHLGRSDGTLALVMLTVVQVPSSLALTIWGQHIAGKRIGFLVGGGVASLTMIVWFIAPVGWDVLLAGMIGASSAWLFVLGLSMPPFLAKGAAVAEVSGVMLGISYLMAFVGPFLGGLLWDATGIAISAFLPILAGCLLIVVLSAFMPDRSQEVA